MEKSRDIQTFNFLFTNYKRRFTHFARTYVDDEMTAEDIAVESLMYYWENREKLKEHTNIPAYVLTVVKLNVWIIYGITYSWRLCRYSAK